MSLLDDVKQLRASSLAALDASHDYYTHTQHAWRLVQQMVREGRTFSVESQTTGSAVDQRELSGLAQGYMTGHLASATFQHFVSLFEDFLLGFLRAWLTEYPRGLQGKQLKFGVVLESADKAEIVQAVVMEELHAISYKSLDDWFEYLNGIVELGCPAADQIARLVEIKASRNVLVHNGGIVNSLYVDKAGELARFKVGDTLEISDRYHRESWQLIKQVVTDIGDAGMAKTSRQSE